MESAKEQSRQGSGQTPRPGRPQDSRPAIGRRDAMTTDGPVVATRLAVVEAKALDGLQSRLGYKTRGAALRGIVRASVGILELAETEVIEFADLRRSIGGLGGNINQLAHLAQVGKLDLDQGDRELLYGTERAMIQLRLYLNDVVNECRRRNLRLYQEFLEADHGR